ncbi:MAG: hypothetical protein QXS18_06585 [Thermoplasmata archaeon]
MNLEKPSIGSLDWGYPLNDNFDKIDDHDHSGTPKGKRIEGISLASTNIGENKILQTDGIGGFRYIDTPSGGGGLGSKVYIIAESGGDYSTISDAYNNWVQGDSFILNPHSNGFWDEPIEGPHGFSLIGYGRNLSKIKRTGYCAYFGNNVDSQFKNLSLETTGDYFATFYMTTNTFTNLLIDNCKIINSGSYSAISLSLPIGSTSDIMVKDSEILSSNSSIRLNTGDGVSTLDFILDNSIVRNVSNNACFLCEVTHTDAVMNLYLYNSIFLISTCNYAINKYGNGTLNIYISNCGTNANYLVDPEAQGTVNIYYMDL